ncbi:MAG: ribosomal protein S18-alanine N-acetyltransferase [Spirochaetes bacterium]|nr:ribosomal protein S18-alanine N-acetyltransferase [Spirochaetota bacterium]
MASPPFPRVPVIRKAGPEDIEAIYAIEQEGRGRWNRRQFSDELSLAFSRFAVMELDGDIVGFTVAWIVGDEIQLNNIGVKRDCRRRGLGSILIEDLRKPGISPPLKRKILLEVSALNLAAIGLYRSKGFVETGRRRSYYDDTDAILMELALHE